MPKPLFCAVALLLASSAAAQIAPTSPARQRAANRQALREAKRADVPYKESHLTVTRQQLKRGSTVGPPGGANTAPPKGEGPRHAGLKLPSLRRPKTEPAP